MGTRALLLCALFGCHDTSVTPEPAAGKPVEPLTVTSPAFGAEAPIPTDATCDGADLSPTLNWSAAPTTARSLAVVVDDPDAPGGTFTHALVWNIKPETRLMGSGVGGGLGGGTAGTNDFGKVGYNGPCPPKGKVHHYRFTVYGVDALLSLRPTDKRADLDRALSHHIVAQGTLTGTYQH